MPRSLEMAGRAPSRSSSGSPAPGSGRPALPLAVEYADVIIVVLAAIPAYALGAPTFGLIVGVAAWVVQRALGFYDRRVIRRRASEPRTQLGLNLFEAFGRIWLLAGAIVAAGVIGGRADGLTAAVTIFVAYSIFFVVRVLSGPPNREDRGSTR
ncbi:MAG TPA: hypothetical protein VMA83_04040 [Solirubrobacteraceae bacterium]|nr:hypothetical protein [Solirubrobacteraceae bacterium]